MKILWNRSIGDNMSFNGIGKHRPDNWSPMEKTIIKDGVDSYPWREIYAWFPVKTITGKRVWMEKVYKRKFWIVWGTGFHMEPEVEYATLFEILGDNEEERLGNSS